MKGYRQLISSAKAALRFSYSPYSKFRVGAAVLTSRGRIFSGCNVENASYGLTNCAERVAVQKAVSEGETRILALAVVTGSSSPAFPCGACLQVIREFGKDVKIILVSVRGKTLVKKSSDLFPFPFLLSFLFFLPMLLLPVTALAQKKEVAKVMVEFAKDPNPDLRILMAQSLGELGGPDSVRGLRKLFSMEKEARVRRAILIQLSGLKILDKEAFGFFRKVVFSDPSKDLRFLALSQLSLLGRDPAFAGELLKICRRIWKNGNDSSIRIFSAVTLRELGDNDPRLSRDILDALASPSVELRRSAALVAAEADSLQPSSGVASASQDMDPEVRMNVSRSMGKSGKTFFVPLLKTLSQDRDSAVRRSALDSLSIFPSAEVDGSLFLEALKDSDLSIRSLSIAVLEKRGELSALPQLKEISLKDPNPSVRLLAKKAIATLSSPK